MCRKNISSVSFSLLVPVSHSHLGVTVTGENIRSRIRRWATKNGLSITFGNRLVMQDPLGETAVESSEVGKIRANHSRMISLCVDPRLQERYQLWKFGHSRLAVQDRNAMLQGCYQQPPKKDWFFTCTGLPEGVPGCSTGIESECHKVTISWAEGDE